MKSRPILFTGPMVRAILENRKTQTRREINPQPESRGSAGALFWRGGPRLLHAGYGADYVHTDLDALRRAMEAASPYGQPGDRLWVREAYEITKWDRVYQPGKKRGSLIGLQGRYLADSKEFNICLTAAESKKFRRWKRKAGQRGSIYLFRSLCRIELEITDLLVERLNDITEDDAIAEGIEITEKTPTYRVGFGPLAEQTTHYKFYGKELERLKQQTTNPVWSYETLWESINGPGSWQKNPWVWVLEFKKL